MLYNILGIGRSGLNAMQHKLDATADNVSNVETIGYKKKNIGFQELLINQIHENEVIMSDNVGTAGMNAGVKSGIATIDYNQGTFFDSPGKFHMAIQGNGFFGVLNRSGELALTRNGEFQLNEDMSVSDANGNLLDIDFSVDKARWENGNITIGKDGTINLLNNDNKLIKLGKVKMYYPEVMDEVVSVDANGYILPGNIALYNSQDNPQYFGTINQNMLERSNVELSEGMVDMITAQRAYALNSRVVQTTDDILGIVNGIKR